MINGEIKKYNITVRNILDMVLDPKNNLNPDMTLSDLFFNSQYFMTMPEACDKFDKLYFELMELIYSDKLTGYRLPSGEFVIPYDAEVKE